MDDFSQLNTPAFLVDKRIVERNCRVMREKARASSVIFRPHVKTHKVVEVGRMQHGGETGPITASTLAEVEHFAEGGFTDITYAVPIAPEKLGRAADVARRVQRLNLLIDSFEALDALESFGFSFDVFLKIDCGYHRAGVDPDDPASAVLARRLLDSKTVRFGGVLTHAGHSYHATNADEIRAVATQETAAVTRFRQRMGQELFRSIGSTPTASVVERFTDCEEVRPGNYVFYDAFQSAIGSCRFDDIAVSVLATVIGSYPERNTIVVDAGALALSKDLGPDHINPQFGYGIVCDLDLKAIPAMRLIALSQEHGKIATLHAVPVGTQLRIVPNHSCLTAAMYDRYHVVDGGALAGEWRPVRGW
ncbi:MAG: DSD1 family PLP-dependent enzyme [Thermoanaerobaculia bacterium]